MENVKIGGIVGNISEVGICCNGWIQSYKLEKPVSVKANQSLILTTDAHDNVVCFQVVDDYTVPSTVNCIEPK